MAHAPEIGFGLSSNPLFFVSGLSKPVSDQPLEGTPGWNDPNVGVTTQALGALAAREILHGRLPWWNPYSGVGLPLAAEMQDSALFLPFVLLLGDAAHGVLWLKLCMQVIAGVATFALLRQLGVARRVAVLGGLLYEMNGTFALMGHAPIMPVPFLPLLLLGIERALARAQDARRGGGGWISIAIAYSLYAGFPETALINGLLALAWAAYRLVKERPDQRRRFAATVTIAGSLGVLLAAPVILPFLELLARSYSGVHGVMFPVLSPVSYAMFLVPYLIGPIDYGGQWWVWPSGYFPLSLAFLGTLALVRGSGDFGLRVTLALWIVVALAISADLPGFGAVYRAIPVVRTVFFSRFAMASWELAGILLAAFALDDYHRGRGAGATRLLFTGMLWAAVLALALCLARPTIVAVLQVRPHYPVFLFGSLGAALAVTTALATLIRAAPAGRHTTTLCGLLAVEAIALFAFPLLSGTRARTYDRAAVAFLRSHLGMSRFYTLGPLNPNYGALFAVASINHQYLPVPRVWVDYVRLHLDPEADAVGFVGYLPVPLPGAETRAQALALRLSGFEAVGVKFVLTEPGRDPFAAARTGTVSPMPPPLVYRDEVVNIYQLPSPAPYFEVQGGTCALTTLGRQAVRTVCASPARLLRRELFFPGWHAGVNGHASSVERDGEIFQRVALPAGAADVRFAYAPRYIGWAYAAFSVGTLGLLVGSLRLSGAILRRLRRSFAR